MRLRPIRRTSQIKTENGKRSRSVEQERLSSNRSACRRHRRRSNVFDNSRDNSSPQEGQGGIIPLGATGSLAVFDDMRREVAEASTTAQVKDVLTQVAGLKAAARTAHNREIEANAAVIRLEAERKLGQLMKAQADTVGLNQGGGDQRSDHRDSKNPGGLPTLAEAGIDKNLAKRARKAASMSDFEFEETKKNKRETALIPVRRSPPARRRKTAMIGEPCASFKWEITICGSASPS
jgi:hypothetical protein